MSEDNILNLNRFRKAKEKAEKKKEAQSNRLRHGRSKAERQEEHDKEQRAKRKHEGHKLGQASPSEAEPDAEG